MFDAVRNGESRYSDAQRAAWVPKIRGGPEWIERLSSQSIFVGHDSTAILGIMSLAKDGYIDLAFIRPAAQGTGLFRRLFSSVEELAQQLGEQRLWVHASLMAEPAFSASGFTIVCSETVEVRGQTLDRFLMEKRIAF